MRAGGLEKMRPREHTKIGLINTMYSKSLSQQKKRSKLRPDLQGTVYDACDVERQAF